MPTTKLYWEDPFKLTFETSAATVASWHGAPSLVLGETAFYPEAGGQLGDTGHIDVGSARFDVTDTQVSDDGLIHHLLAAAPAEGSLDGPARGAVDEGRRRDMMAHHTAQHMLSAALAEVARAETVSARLGKTSSTIDLDVPGASDATLARAEDLVNAVVRSDVPIRALFPTESELAALKLRRAPKVTQGIRVIDIEGFDLSPCGGTHCTRTGQIGVVRVAAVEKYKGMTRVSFHAAGRALEEMRSRDRVLAMLGSELTCGVADLGAAVGKLKAELRSARESLGQSRSEVARRVADEALAKNPPVDGEDTRITLVREGDDVATLRVLANRLTARPDVVAVCLSRIDGELEHAVVVQRGSACTFDCGAWLKKLAAAYGGRGGGRAERAEGRLPLTAVQEAVTAS